jgi:hypothetical protein
MLDEKMMKNKDYQAGNTQQDLHGVQGVASSNPAAPTSNTKGFSQRLETLFPLCGLDGQMLINLPGYG